LLESVRYTSIVFSIPDPALAAGVEGTIGSFLGRIPRPTREGAISRRFRTQGIGLGASAFYLFKDTKLAGGEAAKDVFA
jgi:hypothetical protein